MAKAKPSPAHNATAEGKRASASKLRRASEQPKVQGGVQKAAAAKKPPAAAEKQATLKKPEDDMDGLEKIVGHSDQSGVLKYKVRWTGFDYTHDTWELGSKLTGYEEKVQEYRVEAEAAALLAKARKAKAGMGRARRAPASRKKATPAKGTAAVKAAGKATSGVAAGGGAGALPEGAVQKKAAASSSKKAAASGSKKAAAGGGEKAATGASGKKAAGGAGGVKGGKSSNVFEVEKILATREVDGRGGKKLREYKIRWVGFGSEEDTWEPERNLGKAALAAYNASLAVNGAAV